MSGNQLSIPSRRDGIPAELTEGLSVADAKCVRQVTLEIHEFAHKTRIDAMMTLGEKNTVIHGIYSKPGCGSKYGAWLNYNEIDEKFDERCRDLYRAFGGVKDKRVLTQFAMAALYYLAKDSRSSSRDGLLKMAAKDKNVWVSDKFAKEYAASKVGNTLPLISTEAKKNPPSDKPRLKRLPPILLDPNNKDAGDVVVRCEHSDREHRICQAIEQLEAYKKRKFPKVGTKSGSPKKETTG